MKLLKFLFKFWFKIYLYFLFVCRKDFYREEKFHKRKFLSIFFHHLALTVAKRKIRYWGKVTNRDRSYIFKCFRISRKADVNTFTSDGRCTLFAIVLNCSISRESYIYVYIYILFTWRQVELSRLVLVFEKFYPRLFFENKPSIIAHGT